MDTMIAAVNRVTARPATLLAFVVLATVIVVAGGFGLHWAVDYATTAHWLPATVRHAARSWTNSN